MRGCENNVHQSKTVEKVIVATKVDFTVFRFTKVTKNERGGNEMTKVDVKPLTNIDLLALIRTISLELENRECAVTKYVEREIPSTVEEVEHDGKLLRKVNRKSDDGDYVRFHNQINRFSLKDDVIYGPVKSYPNGALVVKGFNVYLADHNRTLETVEVFEVVGGVDGTDSIVTPAVIKSPNQQRAELIQRAREFVEGQKDILGRYLLRITSNTLYPCSAEFSIDEKERTVTCVLRAFEGTHIRKRVTSYCHPNDVFHADIGKAIVLAKALKNDIPLEFLDAVQPDMPVIGMIFKGCEGDIREIAPIGQWTQESMKSAIDSEYVEDYPIQILDDTGAEYEVSQ